MTPRTLRWLAAGALVASVVVPTSLVRGGPRICAFHAVTGRPCPSCGMTRSWNAMGHGEVRRALGFHPLGPAAFAAAAAIALGGDDRAQRLLTPDPRMRPALGALAVAWVTAWAWRLASGGD